MTHVKVTTKTLIVNEKNQLLILKIGVHTKQPERSHTLDLPGGFVDEGEFERAGAVREVLEETSIEINESNLELIWANTDYFEPRDASFTHLFYLVKLDHTPEVKVSWEHESFEWVDFNHAVENFSADRPRFKKVAEYVRQHHIIQEA